MANGKRKGGGGAACVSGPGQVDQSRYGKSQTWGGTSIYSVGPISPFILLSITVHERWLNISEFLFFVF